MIFCVVLNLGKTLRYYPLVRQMKTMREKGDLGEIFSNRFLILQDWLFLDTDYNWRLEPEKSGNSRAIADIGSHLMDIIEYVTGLTTKEVLADFNIIHKTRKKPLKAVATYSGEDASTGRSCRRTHHHRRSRKCFVTF